MSKAMSDWQTVRRALELADAYFTANLEPDLEETFLAVRRALAVSFPIQQDADDIGQQEKGAEK